MILTNLTWFKALGASQASKPAPGTPAPPQAVGSLGKAVATVLAHSDATQLCAALHAMLRKDGFSKAEFATTLFEQISLGEKVKCPDYIANALAWLEKELAPPAKPPAPSSPSVVAAAARAELAAKEASLRVELRESTERLEGVQKHVMLQVADARELQRRAEDQAARANHRGDKLATDLESLRGQLAEVLPAHERALASLAEASGEVSGLRKERDGLKETLARTTGQLDAATTQFTVLTARIADRQIPGSGARKKRQAPQIARKT